ncbi:MAG: hypothetical protein K0S65_908 [Labilithrix sp.]|nr:hypothetical protein [Labilithrix sp.]
MGARIFLVGTGVSLIAAAFVIQACGETEPATVAPVVDSGPDVVDTGAPDTGPKVEEDSGGCDTTADFTSKIPDASIADGATTSGICLQCAHTKCGPQLDDCNTDCTCQGLAGEALDCYLKNTTNPIVCAGSFTGVDTNTQQLGLALITCISSGCKEECATEAFDGGQ